MATSDKYVDQEMENYPKEHDAIRNMLYNYLTIALYRYQA